MRASTSVYPLHQITYRKRHTKVDVHIDNVLPANSAFSNIGNPTTAERISATEKRERSVVALPGDEELSTSKL